MEYIHAASIGGFEQLMKNVDVVIDKVISILKKEIEYDTPINCLPQNSDVEYINSGK